MAEYESSVIAHLIEVETQASSVLDNARDEASKIINAAKAEADKQYLADYNSQLSKIEESTSRRLEEIKAKADLDIKSYKAKIESSPQNPDSFNEFLDKIF